MTLYPGEYISYNGRTERVATVTTKRAGTFFNDYDVSLVDAEVDILTLTRVELTPRIGIVDRVGLSANINLTTNTYGADAATITAVNVYYTKFLDMPQIVETFYRAAFP